LNIPPTYLAHEDDYLLIVSNFVDGKMRADDFVRKYFALWKSDRDEQWKYIEQMGNSLDPREARFCEILDRIFTACDSYSEKPTEPYEISEQQLVAEVSDQIKLLATRADRSTGSG
jgi:hypothetical protein